MRWEKTEDELRLYFKHTSGRNFVITETLFGQTEAQAKAKLIKRMGEMNGLHTSAEPTEG